MCLNYICLNTLILPLNCATNSLGLIVFLLMGKWQVNFSVPHFLPNKQVWLAAFKWLLFPRVLRKSHCTCLPFSSPWLRDSKSWNNMTVRGKTPLRLNAGETLNLFVLVGMVIRISLRAKVNKKGPKPCYMLQSCRKRRFWWESLIVCGGGITSSCSLFCWKKPFWCQSLVYRVGGGGGLGECRNLVPRFQTFCNSYYVDFLQYRANLHMEEYLVLVAAI